MEVKVEKMDWLFLILCLIVGIVAEEAFFRDQIGISYFVFIVVFYMLFFWRFRSFSFSHQRLGYLVLIAVWILSASYYLSDSVLFYTLNLLVIPSLVIFHLALVTLPKKLEWSSIPFIGYIFKRLGDGFLYSVRFSSQLTNKFKQNSNPKKYDVVKKILIGMVISVPILFIVLNLLIEADTQFARILNILPNLLTFRVEYIIRLCIILLYTFGFFGFMQALKQKKLPHTEGTLKPIAVDGIITLTVLLLMNVVYLLFVAVQFKYFFSGTLEDGYTYAEYARCGFFELLFVTLINLSVTTGVISFTKNVQGALKQAIRFALTILVLASGVLLVSAFMRLTMYEDAYGFTFTRVLAHSFMIFLMVIFAYTLVKIWLEKLSLFHFYFIAALLYYVGINVVNLDQFVVEQNLTRYEKTGKIDIHYLNNMSATGTLGLIELYKKDPHVPGLKELLEQQKEDREYIKSDAWQSHNWVRDKAYKELGRIQF